MPASINHFLSVTVIAAIGSMLPNVWSVTGPAVLRAVLARPEAPELLDGITIIDDDMFIRYFEPVYGLEYKKTDAHWFVARESGINIFKD